MQQRLDATDGDPHLLGDRLLRKVLEPVEPERGRHAIGQAGERRLDPPEPFAGDQCAFGIGMLVGGRLRF